MEVPERAVWARTLLAELNRVLNHLMFLGLKRPLKAGEKVPVKLRFERTGEVQVQLEVGSMGQSAPMPMHK